MPDVLRYDPSAAVGLLPAGSVEELQTRLEAAREEVVADIALFESGGNVPAEKQPLDAGFIRLPEQLLAESVASPETSQIGRINGTAVRLREELDRVVVLGIGGSYMGARALFEGVCHPWHNELSRDDRNGVPRIYFEGNNVDSDVQQALLSMLARNPEQASDLASRWGIVVISKSGGTLETALSFRLFRQAAEELYAADAASLRRSIVPVTGESGKLRDITNEQGYESHFPIPDGVGGRFSIFTAVGLLPAAVLGLDVQALLRGAADMTERFFTAPAGENPVVDYTAVCHAWEQQGAVTRILSTWGKRLEAAGLWYDQLLAESLGKEERGALPLTVVNTRDLHSRGQQHQEGIRDKLITNLIVESPNGEPLGVPQFSSDLDNLDRYASKTVPDVLAAAIQGTNQAYAEVARPTADVILPKLDEYALGQYFQMMMLATVLEGRLIGINPYGQPGVEAYKQKTMALLA